MAANGTGLANFGISVFCQILAVAVNETMWAREMVAEAVSNGFCESQTHKQDYPRLQLRTVNELMDGILVLVQRRRLMPSHQRPFPDDQ